MIFIPAVHHSDIVSAGKTGNSISKFVRLAVVAGQIVGLHRKGSRSNLQRSVFNGNRIVGSERTCIPIILKCVSVSISTHINEMVAASEIRAGDSFTRHEAVAHTLDAIPLDFLSVVNLRLRHGAEGHSAGIHRNDTRVKMETFGAVVDGMCLRKDGNSEIVAVTASIDDTCHSVIHRSDEHGISRGEFVAEGGDGRHRRIAEVDRIGLVGVSFTVVHSVRGGRNHIQVFVSTGNVERGTLVVGVIVGSDIIV